MAARRQCFGTPPGRRADLVRAYRCICLACAATDIGFDSRGARLGLKNGVRGYLRIGGSYPCCDGLVTGLVFPAFDQFGTSLVRHAGLRTDERLPPGACAPVMVIVCGAECANLRLGIKLLLWTCPRSCAAFFLSPRRIRCRQRLKAWLWCALPRSALRHSSYAAATRRAAEPTRSVCATTRWQRSVHHDGS